MTTPKSKEDALDLLFGENTNAKESLNELKEQIKDEEHGFNEQISTHSMNEKSVIDVVKEKVEEFKEYNGLTTDPNDKLISTKNSDNALPDELAKQDGVLISSSNSDRALPDELSKEDGIPITKVTEGIHVADNTDNTELISTHNSERAMDEKPITTNTEEISVISTHNSSKFVDESFN